MQDKRLIPIVNQSFKYASGCLVSYTDTETLSVSTGKMRDSTDTFDIDVDTPLDVSSTFVGANGLDAGTIDSDTWYAIFLIYDPTHNVPVATLLSTSFTQPVLPSVNGTTYGAFRLIGFWLTNSDSEFVSANTCGVSNQRYFQHDSPINVLDAGTYPGNAVDLSSAVPAANFGKVKLWSSFVPAAAGDAAGITDSGITDLYIISGIVGAVYQSDLFEVLPTVGNDGIPTIGYSTSTSTVPTALTLNVVGFDFYI